jgi:hypothetical protein
MAPPWALREALLALQIWRVAAKAEGSDVCNLYRRPRILIWVRKWLNYATSLFRSLKRTSEQVVPRLQALARGWPVLKMDWCDSGEISRFPDREANIEASVRSVLSCPTAGCRSGIWNTITSAVPSDISYSGLLQAMICNVGHSGVTNAWLSLISSTGWTDGMKN